MMGKAGGRSRFTIEWFAVLIALPAVAPTFGVEEQLHTGHQYLQWNMDIKFGHIISYLS